MLMPFEKPPISTHIHAHTHRRRIFYDMPLFRGSRQFFSFHGICQRLTSPHWQTPIFLPRHHLSRKREGRIGPIRGSTENKVRCHISSPSVWYHLTPASRGRGCTWLHSVVDDVLGPAISLMSGHIAWNCGSSRISRLLGRRTRVNLVRGFISSLPLSASQTDCALSPLALLHPSLSPSPCGPSEDFIQINQQPVP